MSFQTACRAGTLALIWALAAGVNAADPLPAPLSIRLSPAGHISLAWHEPDPGWVYSVQSRASVTPGIWLTRSDQRPWPVDVPEWSEPQVALAQFYRVLALPAADRGRVLSFSLASTATLPEIELLLRLSDIPVTPIYEVGIYQIVYETLDVLGGRTVASGAVALPVGASHSLPLMSYQHGTLVLTNDAPSSLNESILPGVGFASLGYAVVLPDLLGFGSSSGLHPYHHARSAATASVDALRAVRRWAAESLVELNGQLFLIGYSQGGHTTMALHRELELYHTDEFAVTASAPMAGAYDLSGVTSATLLSGQPVPNPYYLLYLLAAYQEVYQLTNSLSQLLAAPYASTLPPLMNGATPGHIINEAMPPDPRLILRPEILESLESQADHPIRTALKDNDVYNWKPVAPMRLFHCRGDQDVTFSNSEIAHDRFQELGATHVQLVDPDPAADHTGCALPAFVLAKDWFESLRE